MRQGLEIEEMRQPGLHQFDSWYCATWQGNYLCHIASLQGGGWITWSGQELERHHNADLSLEQVAALHTPADEYITHWQLDL